MRGIQPLLIDLCDPGGAVYERGCAGIGEYLLGILATVTVAAVAKLLAYRRGGSAAERAAISLVLLWAVAYPLAEGTLSLNITPPDIDSPYSDTLYYDTAREAFEAGLCQALSQHFGVSEESVTVRITELDLESMRIKEAKVILSGSAIFKRPEDIKKYIKEIIGLEEEYCEVQIRLGG
jgi:hypothetical protein